MSSSDVVLVYGAIIPSNRAIDLIWQTPEYVFTSRPSNLDKLRDQLFDGIDLSRSLKIQIFSRNQEVIFLVLKETWVSNDTNVIRLDPPSDEMKKAFNAWCDRMNLDVQYGEYLVTCGY